MDIEIRRLTPDLLEDYLQFFDEVAHEDCYCVCFSSDNQNGKDLTKKDVRREYAIRYIKEGKLKGYLAYANHQVIGWCNANNKETCYNCYGWTNMLSGVGKNDSSSEKGKVKSIFCFTISPDLRRKGIATKLLDYVLKDAENDGYTYVEAYPYKEFINVYYDHMGPLGLYKKFDFAPHNDLGKRVIMRKYLR